MSLFRRWTDTLDRLRTQGRLRQLRVPHGVDLSSNDYLGYGKRLRPTAVDLPRSGMASRLLRGHHPIWEEVEARLADWHGAEAVLMMTSGFAANEGLLSTILTPDDWVAVDERIHASSITGLQLARPRKFVFQHNDLDHLEQALRHEVAHRPAGAERFILSESLFSMDGDRPSLPALVNLAQRYEAHVLIDEAHTTGCLGPQGSGAVDAAGLRHRVLATVHTGGKALGVPGAYICGSRLLRDLLINRCRQLLFTTALPAALGAWWLDALDEVRQDDAGRSRLHTATAGFRAALAQHGIDAAGDAYIVPIVLGADARAVATACRLQARGYDIRAIRPPSVPEGSACLRLSIHADHDPEMLAQLASHLAEAIAS